MKPAQAMTYENKFWIKLKLTFLDSNKAVSRWVMVHFRVLKNSNFRNEAKCKIFL